MSHCNYCCAYKQQNSFISSITILYMHRIKFYGLLSVLCLSISAMAQDTIADNNFSLPLYLDLPGEMNVSKGYKELNVLTAYQNFSEFNYYRFSTEFAFSPMNNLGLEIEVPFNLYSLKNESEEPENKIEAVRVGGMYSFSNMKRKKTVLAIGFVNDVEFSSFKEFGKPLFEGNALNPFLAIAKIWGDKFSTVFYTGPNFHTSFDEHNTQTEWKLNTTLGYKISKKNNFINVEINQSVYKSDWQTTIRPQARIFIADQWSVGAGISFPVDIEAAHSGGFMRLIFSPE